jgi:hypothetical protein
MVDSSSRTGGQLATQRCYDVDRSVGKPAGRLATTSNPGAPVEIVKNIALVLHFVGLASILGAFLVQMSAPTKRIDAAMFHGALTQLVTGIVLVGANEMLDHDVNNPKVGVKLVVLLVITALVWRNRKKDTVSTGIWGAVGGLTLLNVVLAVFW